MSEQHPRGALPGGPFYYQLHAEKEKVPADVTQRAETSGGRASDDDEHPSHQQSGYHELPRNSLEHLSPFQRPTASRSMRRRGSPRARIRSCVISTG
jgi:hypothetical protein